MLEVCTFLSIMYKITISLFQKKKKKKDKKRNKNKEISCHYQNWIIPSSILLMFWATKNLAESSNLELYRSKMVTYIGED